MNMNINNETGTLSIVEIYDRDLMSLYATPVLVDSDPFIVSIVELENVERMTLFKYDTLGANQYTYLEQQYRISRDGLSWSGWFDLYQDFRNFPETDSKDKLYIDIKFIKRGQGSITLLEWSLEAILHRELSESLINLKTSESMIIKPPYIYKVFNLSEFEIITNNNLDGVLVKWRYSQDNSRSWTNFELLTNDNIKTAVISPIRFFQVEYSITNNSNHFVSISDINLIGDFQNVTLDYKKSNVYGIRECCKSYLLGAYDSDGNFIPNTNMMDDKCSLDSGVSTMTAEQKALLYNPYAQASAVNLMDKLSQDAESMFGHNVIYFLTDPDANGQDHTLHEYQLYNVVCKADIKASVMNNNFPDSQIVMNQFDLNLFEVMEVHLTKANFKAVFGPHRRPSKEDFLYFCDVNRMYLVDHAQQFRNFNNSAVYYKLILKKYTQKSNVKSADSDINDMLSVLTNNSTIDELFGYNNDLDKKSIANKPQNRVLTDEVIRLEYMANIERELIENSSTVISKNYYDLSMLNPGDTAVKYLNLIKPIKKSDNLSFSFWFNINNYIKDEVYNLFHWRDNNNGIDISIVNDAVILACNDELSTFDFEGVVTNDVISLEDEVWYCYVVNINQRTAQIEDWLYKRNVDFEEDASGLKSNKLRLLYHRSDEFTPFEFNISENPVILASDMKITNIRLFNDIQPLDTHNKLLNQWIIGDDSKYLILADNAMNKLELPRYPISE